MASDPKRETRWYVHPPAAADARILLFCFPYAGGGTWIFREWVRQLAPEIAVCAVKLPGRGDRFREVPARNMRELARAIAEAIPQPLLRPFAVFGHSMGALLGFEFVREMAAVHAQEPRRLIVSSAPAPSRVLIREPIHGLPDAQFLKAVQAKYGHPYLEKADPEVIELLLPTLRSDLEMYETYSSRPGEPLTCPISVFVGSDDPLPRTDLQAWAEHTRGPSRLREFAGGHFYLHESEAAVVREVRRLLQEDSGEGPGEARRPTAS